MKKTIERTNRNKLLNINNQWEKISITKHLLFKSFYFMHDFALPRHVRAASTLNGLYSSRGRGMEGQKDIEKVRQKACIYSSVSFTDNLNERVPISSIRSLVSGKNEYFQLFEDEAQLKQREKEEGDDNDGDDEEEKKTLALPFTYQAIEPLSMARIFANDIITIKIGERNIE